MRAKPHRGRVVRAAVGVVALYALLLQVFLLAATPALAVPFGHAICAPGVDGGPDGSGDAPRHDHPCCQAPAAAQVSLPSGELLPARRPAAAAPVVPRPEAVLPRTGPPTHAQSARGPPLR